MIRASFVLLVVLGLVYVHCDPGKVCDERKGLSSVNPDCTEEDEPYCVGHMVGTELKYTCVECMTSCDCDPGDFCYLWENFADFEFGYCYNFDREGDDCRALSEDQIRDPDFPDEWKCAMTHEDPDDPARLILEARGHCAEGTCRECEWDDSGGSGLSECYSNMGRKKARRCVHPGNLRDAYWEYFTDPWTLPHRVWYTAFMVVLVLMFVMMCIQAGLTFSKSKSS